MKKFSLCLLILTLICTWSAEAEGHGLSVCPAYDGKAVSGTAEYHAGVPVVGANVTITGQKDGDKEESWVTVTDKQGKFSIDVTPCRSYRVVIEDGGHRAEGTVQGASGSSGVTDAQIIELRHDIHELEHSIRLRDILGGIGYILGLVGIAMYFKARERRARPRYPAPNRDQSQKQHDESD